MICFMETASDLQSRIFLSTSSVVVYRTSFLMMSISVNAADNTLR